VQNALNAYRKKEFPVNLKKWEETLKPEELKKLPTNIQTVLKLADAKRTPAQKKELTAFFGKQDKQLAQLTAKVAELQKQAPKITMAQTLALGSLRKTHVMRRGDFLRPGVQVDPGTPGVLPALPGAKTRLDLARWLVSGENPLTARVIVNWMWSKYF